LILFNNIQQAFKEATKYKPFIAHIQYIKLGDRPAKMVIFITRSTERFLAISNHQ